MADPMRPAPPFWSVEVELLLTELSTTTNGLTDDDAAERLRKARRLERHRTTALGLLLEQFQSPIMLLLLITAVLSYFLDDATNAVIILFILLASSLLSFWQELSAADAMAKLLAVIESRAMVRRGGRDLEVPLAEIVTGDIVSLRTGDLVPGDCRLLQARDLLVNEASLTGESFPAEKSPATIPLETPLAQRGNVLSLGTHVVSGTCTAVVVATGAETEFGKISERLGSRPPETGFERGLRTYGRLLVRVVIGFTAAVFVINIGLQKPVVESFLFGLALAVGMTPQLLPAITSVVLASGAKALARQQVIVKQLLAIENLGSMTVLCCDKTGTLTEGEVHLHAALDVAGNPSAAVLDEACYNAALQTGFVNPIDTAIRDHHPRDLSNVEKLDERAYDFVRKRLSVLIRQDGVARIISKGAFAKVLECCSHLLDEQGHIVPLAPRRAEIERLFRDLSDQGFRVLGLATRIVTQAVLGADDEREMTLRGFLVFTDPPKQDAPATLAALRDLGISLKIITGDNSIVAAAISHRVGLADAVVISGHQLKSLSGDALRDQVRRVDVFAEVEPQQKEQIIRALQSGGDVVGFLGDGINDAPALHAADVGMSVASAVEVAKEAARIVLLKQDLKVLVQGVEEGRRTFANTLKYVFFAIAANFGYMFSLACASLFLPFLPLLPSQILLVNLLADFPAMALATDNVDPEQIHRPRRWDIQVLSRFMLAFGFSSSMFDFLTFGAIYAIFGRDETVFHTGWFVESTLTGLMILLVVRTQRPFFLSRPGTLFLMTTIAVAVLAVALPYSPLAKPLGFVHPPTALLAITLTITMLYGFGMEAVKWYFQRVCSRCRE